MQGYAPLVRLGVHLVCSGHATPVPGATRQAERWRRGAERWRRAAERWRWAAERWRRAADPRGDGAPRREAARHDAR